MRVFRLIIVVLFALTALVFSVYKITGIGKTDNTMPEISIENDIIDVPLDADEKVLLNGVTAFDNKDGDITDKVFVESISDFISDYTCNVTYSVCDSDNNVASAVRKIRYPDYVPPRFKLNGPLVLNSYEDAKLGQIVGAEDVIDGDISDEIIITNTNYKATVPGTYSMSVQVKNSKGYMIVQKFPIIVEEISHRAPKIVLSDYLVYINSKDKFDPESFIEGVYSAEGYKKDYKCDFESNVDRNKPGIYSVHYYASDEVGDKTHTMLMVIVE